MSTRIEKDTLGEVHVPADKYWGAQTERSRNNFKIGPSGSMPLEIVRAFAHLNEADYYMKCMSAAVQLGEKLKKRGQRADAGSRLEFVITEGPPGASKVYEKIECADYYAAHAGIIKLDILYYAEKVATPIDKMLNIIYGKDDVEREVLPLRKMDWGMPHVGVRAPMYDRYQRDMAKAMCNRYKEERKVVQQLQSYFNPHVEL